MFLWCTLALRLYWSCSVQKGVPHLFNSSLFDTCIYSLRTWCGLNLDARALFWVFTTHRSQSIYNCLWLHCFWFKCPIVECLNDSSMFFRSNDRPTTLSPLDEVYVYLCIGYICDDCSALSCLFLFFRLWSFFFLVVASSVEIWFALGCNMSIKHDARMLNFFLRRFLFLTFYTGIFPFVFSKTTHSNSDRFLCLWAKTRPNYGAFVNWMHSAQLNLINARGARKHLCIAVFFSICSSWFFVLNAT